MTTLAVTNIQILYNRAIEAVRDVSLEVAEGRVVALLGSNGAGKSTLLKAISNILYPEDGAILNGRITFGGADIRALPAAEIVRYGIVHVPEGRRLFARMKVEENLALGGFLRSRHELAASLEFVYDLFPVLGDKRHMTGGYLSGGEQQMVAIGRALVANPRMLMLDEPSLGLAPKMIELIFATIARLNKERRISILLVEQNASLALDVADYGYIMENGRIVLDGPAAALKNNQDVQEFYLGFSDKGARKNLREVKHYKRRKRWLS